jgi:CRISPR/Cas system CMR-associated protein Cmr3 (group 5 of RAMP superfamily)
MLFDENCGNYEFSTLEMWAKLEQTFFSELYNKAKKNVPGLIQKETEYILQKEKENTVALDKKGQTGKKKKEGKSFSGLNASDAPEIYEGEPTARVESGQTVGVGSG